ncbi:MAG: triple tyrosine motif-containing protein [Cyclobacteriaceae bacterium]
MIKTNTGLQFLKMVVCLLLCVLATGNLMVWSQGNVSPEHFKYYEINQISAKNLIKSIVKDQQGYIWLATDAGIIRYDGLQTQSFFKEFNNSYTKEFLLRDNGQLLVIFDTGLYEIISNEDTTYFQSFAIKDQVFDQPLNYPKSIYEDQQGNVWIGEFASVVRINQGGFRRFELGEPYRSISYHRSFSFAEDAFGHLWIAPYKGRLLSYQADLDSLVDVEIEYPVTTVSSIIAVKGDHLLIGGKEGLLKLKVDSDKNILASKFITDLKDISVAFSVNNKSVYVGTWNQGMYEYAFDDNSFSRLFDVPFSDILDIYYDNNTMEMWITGSENTGLLKGTVIDPVEPIGKNRIESMALDRNNNIYYSIGQELYLFDGEKVREVVSSKQTFFNQIIADKDRIYVGDPFGSIFYYDLARKNIEVVQDNTLSNITHAYLDSYGNKWFAGNYEWLSKIDLLNNHITYPNVKNSAVVRESPEGVLFCGTQGSEKLLYRYDKSADAFQRINIQYDFKSSESILVMDMDFDQEQNLWLATDEGLIKVEYGGGIYQNASKIKLEGMPVDQAFRAIRITGENLWLVTDNGLVCYTKDHIMLYTNENGLPSKIIKDRGLTLDKENNRMLIASAKGLASINLNELLQQQTKKPIINSLLVNNERKNVAGREEYKFAHNARIQIQFNTLSYPGNNLLYQTRILELEQEWSAPSSNPSISFMGFKQGNYTLEVRSRSRGELWSAPLSFHFTILPAWYSTWWAYILFIVLGASLITIAVKLYNVHLIRQKKRLQKIIEERTGEINRQKNEIIDQKNKIIAQKEELIEKNKTVLESQNALSEADLKYYQLKEKQLQDQIEFKNKQITTHTLNIIQKNETLKGLKDELEVLVKKSNGEAVEIRKTLRKIDESFKLDKDWDEFKLYFEQVYTGFYTKLKLSYPELSNQELRHCALIRLNLNAAECASILGISPDSVKVSRTRIRKKLNLPGTQSLSDFILSI